MEHGTHFLDHPIEIQFARFEDLLAAERQQLAGQRGGAFPGAMNLGNHLPQRIAGAQLRQHQVAVPLITVSRLLKSCATPPARRPMDSIFCA